MRRLLLLASAIVFVDTLFFAAISPLLPSFSDEFGLSKAEAGVLLAAYPAGTFLGALPGGWIAARAGVKPTVLLGLGLMGVSSLAFAFAPSAPLLDAARLVQGVGGAFSWAGAFGWLLGAAPRERRGELIGSATAAAIGGALCGPVLGAAAAAVGRELVFSSVAVVGAALAVWAVRTPASVPERPPRLRELASATADRRVVMGMWLTALPGLLFGTLGVLAPLQLDDFGAAAATIAAVFVAAGLLEAAVNPVIGRVADRRGRVGPAMLGLGFTAVVFALLALAGSSWLLAALVIAAGPAVGILWTPAMTLMSDGAEALGLEQGFAFALLNLSWSMGETAGAAGGSRLAEAFGDPLPYALLATLCSVTLALFARTVRRRRTPAAGIAT